VAKKNYNRRIEELLARAPECKLTDAERLWKILRIKAEERGAEWPGDRTPESVWAKYLEIKARREKEAAEVATGIRPAAGAWMYPQREDTPN
jgi:hypothetical protein